MARVINYDLSDNLIIKIADLVEAEFIKPGRDISRLVFVFGGKRPALFLKKEFSRRIKKGYFSPQFFSIDEFIDYLLLKKQQYSNLKDLDACFYIYSQVKEIAPHILEKRETFSQFLPWARELLKFIDQLDLEDVDADNIKNIQLNAEIGYDVPESINNLLMNLVLLREKYHQHLKDTNTYSRGFKYLLASRIKDFGLPEFEKIFFCNFFYLHKTEERIIKNLYSMDKADLIFQADSQWPVLEDLSKRLSISIDFPGEKEPGYDLEIFAGFDLHSQAGLVKEIIQKLPHPEKTVIVLPKSDSLIPLISQISAVAEDFNVSLGYPLKRSPLYSLFECIFKAQATKRDNLYYSRDYLKALSHPLPKNLEISRKDSSITRILVHKIEEIILGREETDLGGSLFVDLSEIENSRQVYELALEKTKHMDVNVSYEDLKKTLKALHEILFYQWEEVRTFKVFAQRLGGILDILLEKSYLNTYPFNLTIMERIYNIKEELQVSPFVDEVFLPEEVFKIFENKLDNEIVAFSGSPLKGLQVLGLLETRSLNFENVIIMDMNENALPLLKITDPLIPREVMLKLGINQLEKEEEIQRYQFKRLISSAKKVCLIYEENSKNEKSRFIEELIWQKEKKENRLDVLPIPKASFEVGLFAKSTDIKKTKQEIGFLREKSFSASSVNTYLECPLKFYYQYVLGLEEKEDLLDEPEARDLGTFIHELLEETFSCFKGKNPVIDKKFENYFFGCFEDKFNKGLAKKMKSDSFLVKHIMKFRLNKFLNNERKRDVKLILGLESKFEADFSFGDENFKFQARIDRIDKLSDGSIMVIDYKTGSVSPVKDIMGLKEIELNRQFIRDNIKSFQLPVYLYFIDKNYPGADSNAALYSLRDLDNKDYGMVKLFKSEEQFKNKKDIMEIYFKCLGFIMREIIDPEVDFVRDDTLCSRWQSCPFSSLCK